MVRPLLILALAALLLGGCAGAPRGAPVESRVQRVGAPPLSYTVRTGDTLYMIAMEFDLDYRELARWNGIGPPYLIHKGQRLRLHSSDASDATVRSTRRAPHVVVAGETLDEIARRYRLSAGDLAEWNGLDPQTRLHAGQRLRLRPRARRGQRADEEQRPALISRPVRPAAPQATESTPPLAGGAARWQWPVDGRVIRRFADVVEGPKGLDIAGKRGDPVRAAAAGEVVYSGAGLVRYGQLLIIKHDDDFLTAYAHNETLRVREGERVEAGQRIADMGSSGVDQVMLHFEVRKEGVPVDPELHLPPRP